MQYGEKDSERRTRMHNKDSSEKKGYKYFDIINILTFHYVWKNILSYSQERKISKGR